MLALLIGAMGFVLWYVIDRRAGNRAAPAVTVPGPSAGPVDLANHNGQTIDLSSGRPVVRDTAADKAALDHATKEMADAALEVTFTVPAKKAQPDPTKE